MTGNSKEKNKGFTLTELLVAMTLFVVAVASASDLFASASRAQRKSIETQKVLDNGRYVLESVAKTLRMGIIKTADGGGVTLQICHPTKGVADESTCQTGATGYKLVTYALSSGQVTETDESGASVTISSSNVKVDRLFFNISGVGAGGTQPRVTILLKVKSKDTIGSFYQASVDLETTLSQRNLDTL